MFKYIAASVLAVSTPVAAMQAVSPSPNIGLAVVTVDSATTKDGVHSVFVHKGMGSLALRMGGCPVPQSGADLYLIGIPNVGVFATAKQSMDASLSAHGNSFADASKELIDSGKMCVVVGARAVPKV